MLLKLHVLPALLRTDFKSHVNTVKSALICSLAYPFLVFHSYTCLRYRSQETCHLINYGYSATPETLLNRRWETWKSCLGRGQKEPPRPDQGRTQQNLGETARQCLCITSFAESWFQLLSSPLLPFAIMNDICHLQVGQGWFCHMLLAHIIQYQPAFPVAAPALPNIYSTSPLHFPAHLP